MNSIYVANNGCTLETYDGVTDGDMDDQGGVGDGNDPRHESHEIRQISSAEYYTKAGFKQTIAKINMNKTDEIRELEAAITTNRTTSMTGIRQYIDTSLAATAAPGLRNHQHSCERRPKVPTASWIRRTITYSCPATKKKRRPPRTTTIADGQEAPPPPPPPKSGKWKKAEVENDGNKVPVIVFGDAKFGRSGKGGGALADRCQKQLSKADKAGRLVLINMDEYNTSQVCSKCGNKTLAGMELAGRQFRMYTVLACGSCNTVWQWDINASRNIRSIFINLVTTGQRRIANMR
ncbi:unnamed protein product [Absidia cylindrospora]